MWAGRDLIGRPDRRIQLDGEYIPPPVTSLHPGSDSRHSETACGIVVATDGRRGTPGADCATVPNPSHNALRKLTHRLITSKPRASCARSDSSLSIHVSDAISRHPCGKLGPPGSPSARVPDIPRIIRRHRISLRCSSNHASGQSIKGILAS